MQRVELDAMLLEKILVMPHPIQQLTLWKATSPLLRDEMGWYTLDSRLDAMGARELAIAFDLAMLALHAGQNPLRFHRGCRRARARWQRHRGGAI